jgi:hypothetical protein
MNFLTDSFRKPNLFRTYRQSCRSLICSDFSLTLLPTEIIRLLVDNLNPKGLQSLLHAVRWLPELLTSQQIATKNKEGNTILYLLADNGEGREADLIDPLLPKDTLNLEPRNLKGGTPLVRAAWKGHI